MSYRIAGIDVHKKMLAVVVSDVEIESEYHVYRRLLKMALEELRLRALARHPGTVVRRARRLYGVERRRTDRPTGPGDGQSAQPAPGCR
jgi:hypothetical protein